MLFFVCRGMCIGLQVFENSYYVFDSHSRDDRGFTYSNGSACIVFFSQFIHMCNYLRIQFYKGVEELFELLDKGKIVKESIPDILSHKAKNPGVKTSEVIRRFGLGRMTRGELLKIVKDVVRKNKGQPINKIIGIVMSRVRGKAHSEDVVEIVRKEVDKVY